MGILYKNFRAILIGGACSLAVTACVPSSHISNHDAYAQGNYGYSQTGYGYESPQAAAQHFGYGGALRGPCEAVVQSCGMMVVVPIYPVYQVVTYPDAPEVPVVTYEPAPEPAYIPEPVYQPPVYEPPMQHWPEPDTPVRDWQPLRK